MNGGIAVYFAEGGPFIYPLLLWAFVTGALLVIQLGLPRLRLLPLAFFSGLLMLAFGVMGTAVYLVQAFEAVATAPPDIKLQMICAGTAISLRPAQMALVGAASLIAFGAAVVFVRGVRSSTNLPQQ